MSPAFVPKGMTKIRRGCAFVSYASTFLHLQLRLTQFFAFFLQTRRLSRTSFSLQHFLLAPGLMVAPRALFDRALANKISKRENFQNKDFFFNL
jgi:hypothetical protein